MTAFETIVQAARDLRDLGTQATLNEIGDPETGPVTSEQLVALAERLEQDASLIAIGPVAANDDRLTVAGAAR